MNYLSVQDLEKSYSERILFSNISFGLSRGDKTALIANNGTGKSTLLKILAGKEKADKGSAVFREGIRFGFLDQDPQFKGAQVINDLVNGSHSEVLQIIRRFENALAAQSENFSEQNQLEFEEASAAMEQRNAWDYQRRMVEILDKFGIQDLNQKIETLSGGQRKRLALALLILDMPEVMILDEPTNHLDVEMIEWLEKYMSQNMITVFMVTHDRYFLDRVCNHILELQDGNMYAHQGNYSFFLQKRAEREEVYRIEIEKAGKSLKKELEWMRRMPKARTTKSKARIDAFYELEKKAGGKKVAQEIVLDVKMSRVGGKVLEMKKVNKAYGDQVVLKGFDYTFKKGERIGIIGKNGVGKTTFLNIITGKEPIDSGKLNTGETIVYGYYTQQGIQLKEDKRVIEVLKEIADVIEMSDGSKITAAQLLTQFMFSYDTQYTFVSKLSGGERRRLHLLMTLMKNPNFLILDEPTNDLDLLTLDRLEEFLENYQGCLIMVSHDRYFMDQLIEHLFIFEGDGVIKDYWGPYSDYREQKNEDEKKQKAEAGKIAAKTEIAKESKQKTKLSYKEEKEFESLEKEIAKLELEKSKLEDLLQTLSSDFEKLNECSLKIGEINQAIDEKTFRWLELSELKDSF